MIGVCFYIRLLLHSLRLTLANGARFFPLFTLIAIHKHTCTLMMDETCHDVKLEEKKSENLRRKLNFTRIKD